MPKRKLPRRSAEMRELPAVPMRELDRKFLKEIKGLKQSNLELKHSNEILQKKVDRMELWILTNFGSIKKNAEENSSNEEEDKDTGNVDTDTSFPLPDPEPDECDEELDDANANSDINDKKVESTNESKSLLSLPKIRAKRKELNLEDKIEVIKLTEGGKLSQRKIASMFKIGKTQVGNIVRGKADIKEAYERFLEISGGTRRVNVPIPSRFEKKNKNGEIRRHHIVNRQVKEYYEDRLKQGLYTSGPQLQAKAREIASQFGETKFTASSGWLFNFTKKFNIKLGMKNMSLEMTLGTAAKNHATSPTITPQASLVLNLATTTIKVENDEFGTIPLENDELGTIPLENDLLSN